MDCSTYTSCKLPWNGGSCVYKSMLWKADWYTPVFPDEVGGGWAFVGSCEEVTEAPEMVLAYTLLAFLLVIAFFIGLKMGAK